MKTRTKRTTSPVLNILGRQGTSPSIVRACLPACQPVALVRVCVPASQSARRAWVYVCLPVSQPFGIGFLCVCMRASQPVALGCVCVYPYAPASQPVSPSRLVVCVSVCLYPYVSACRPTRHALLPLYFLHMRTTHVAPLPHLQSGYPPHTTTPDVVKAKDGVYVSFEQKLFP